MKNTIIKRIFEFIKPYKTFLILALLSAVASVSMSLYAPVLIGRAIDLIVGKEQVDFSGLVPILIKLVFAVILSAVFQWLMNLCTNIITFKTVKDMRTQVFNKLESVPLKYIDSKLHGDIISRVVTDIEQISDGLLQSFTQLFTGIITILGTLFFMISINVSIALIVVILTPVSLLVASFIAKRSFKMFSVQSKTRGEMAGLVEEMLGNQTVIKAFRQEEKSQEKFEEINDRLHSCGIKAQFYSSLTNPSTRFVNGLVYTSVGVAGAISVINGQLSVGKLTCFLTYASQFAKPFNEISSVVTELQNAFSSAKRVFEVIDEPVESPDLDNAVVMNSCDGTVEIKDVSFSYNPDVHLIEELNLTVKSGQRIAIVGPTGCGKTTVINLLMRFYDTTKGEIIVSGNNVNKITRNSLRSMYGMVLQDTWIMSGTIRDNIAYGNPGATDEEVIDAAKSAFAHSFIKRLSNGYNTVISEDDDNISQGQKQLLCIARIMLTAPPMLILDEATSNIDTRTEIKIQKAFSKMMNGKTSFIVAHRLSTIKEADVILVMNKGKIVEQGSHVELLNLNGFYSNLYNSQFAGNP